MLSVAVAPGGHPLRALASADGAAPSLPAARAEVSRAADPVWARAFAAMAIAAEWQWTALPADCAQIIMASGLLPKIVRMVAVGGEYVASLRGGCATLCGSSRIPHFPGATLPFVAPLTFLRRPVVAARHLVVF